MLGKGMPKITLGITGLHEILARDYEIEEPYWGPSLLTFLASHIELAIIIRKKKGTELNVVLPAVRNKFIKKSIIYRVQARTYNELPDAAKLPQFKKMLRTVIL